MKKLSVLLLSLLLILSACGKGKENQNNKGSENNKTQVTNTENTENTENSKNTQSTSSEGGFENVNFDSNMTREECIETANILTIEFLMKCVRFLKNYLDFRRKYEKIIRFTFILALNFKCLW